MMEQAEQVDYCSARGTSVTNKMKRNETKRNETKQNKKNEKTNQMLDAPCRGSVMFGSDRH